MTIIQTIILGIIEGIAEFLPISSTFHLIFASRFLDIPATNFTKLFNVFIQAGAILAVVFLYYKKLRADLELVKKILIAFLPTAVLGIFFYKIIKQNFFESFFLMLYAFVGVGLLFLLFEFLVKRNIIKPEKGIARLTYGNAFVIGALQACAFLPGVSRAGVVILVMMALGFRRADSACFSFIISIPTIFAASFFDLYKTRSLVDISANDYLMLVIGFCTAFFFAYLAVKWLIAYLQTHTLNLFAYYRLAVGLLILGIFINLF